MPQNTGPTAGFVTSCSDKQGSGCASSSTTPSAGKEFDSSGVEGAGLLEHEPPLTRHTHSPADIGKILMTVLKLYNRGAVAMLTVHSVSPATAHTPVSF